MENMKKGTLALMGLTLAVVFLSGCVGQSGTTGSGQSKGVIIKNFYPDMTEIYSGDR
jgi:hypothetical protein